MIDPKGDVPRNIFVTDQFFAGDEIPPPPPKHFKYDREDRSIIVYYTIVEDENDPPPPTSLLRLSEMSLEWLRRVASCNKMRGYEFLCKYDLVKFLEAHRYIFPDDFYEQRSLSSKLRAWVGLFATGNFADHYTEVMKSSLANVSYLNDFVSCEREWWWWDSLSPAFYYEIESFSFGMDSFVLFEKVICLKFGLIVREVEDLFDVDESHESYNVWCELVDSEWEILRKRLDGEVLCLEDRVSSLYDLRDRLEENDRSYIYNKGMESIDWNDVNVLRKLPDGWYSVPSESEYGNLIRKDPDVKYNDSVKKAEKRHERILEKEREIDDFISAERLRIKYRDCSHKNFHYKGYWVCKICGLTRQGPPMWAPEVGYENRVLMTKRKDKGDNMSEMCDKASEIFPNIIRNLSLDQVTINNSLDGLMEVFRTYVLTNEDRGKRRFRVSASPKDLCAALLWREVLLRKIPMTMLEFSKRTKVDRMTISTCFARLDDYKDLHIGKRGNPRKKRK